MNNTPLKIVCCAVKLYDGTLLISPYYWDKMMYRQMNLWLLSHNIDIDGYISIKSQLHGDREVKGFIDQHGKFYTSNEAFIIARDNGQLNNPERLNGKQTLYPEDLY